MKIIVSDSYMESLVKRARAQIIKLAQNISQFQDRPQTQWQQRTPEDLKQLARVQRDLLTSHQFKVVKEVSPPNENFVIFVVQNKAGVGYNVTVFDGTLWQVEDLQSKQKGTALGPKVNALLQEAAKATPQQSMDSVTNSQESVMTPTGSPNTSNPSR